MSEQQQETAGEKQARQAYQQAADHLERVKTAKDATGRPRFSFEERSQAERDLTQRQKEMWAANNSGARERYQAGLAAGRKEAGDKRAAEQAGLQAAQEAELKLRLRAVYLGTDQEYENHYEALKAAYYERQALNQIDVDKAQLAARYGGSF
jgi:hypothetical protein